MTISNTLPFINSNSTALFPSIAKGRSIFVYLGISLFIHILIIFFLFHNNRQENALSVSTLQQPLSARLLPSTSPASTPKTVSVKPSTPRVHKKKNTHNNSVTTSPKELLPIEPQPSPEAATPPPMDFLTALNAKRQENANLAARENAEAQTETQPPSQEDIRDAIINRNLQTMSRQRDGTSGIFRITNVGTRNGSFSFRGWTTDRSDQWRESYEVDAGLHGNVELAIIKKMIELIRTHYQENFNWESPRKGRVVVLSARLEDNAELEAFLMKEFFQN